MTRIDAEKKLLAMMHWSNGGDLWFYDNQNQEWVRHTEASMNIEELDIENLVVEDSTFEERKNRIVKDWIPDTDEKIGVRNKLGDDFVKRIFVSKTRDDLFVCWSTDKKNVEAWNYAKKIKQ